MAGSLDVNINDRPSGAALTPLEWRTAMGCFPSGVTIVSTWRDGVAVGSTVNAFCSVSLDPPLLLVCLDRANPILQPLQQAGVFGVNILDEHSGALARRFALPPEEAKFAEAAHSAADGGAPWLSAAPVFIDCILENVHAAGDHFIMVGRGVRIEHATPINPLLYHRGGFPKLKREE